MRGAIGFVLAALVALSWAQATGATTPHAAGGTFARQLPDDYDYLYGWDEDRWVRVDRKPLGTIRLSTPAASGIRSSHSAPLEKTICLRISSGPTRGRRCWREYGLENEADPARDYKVWWTTGSSRARQGARLVGIRDGVRAGGAAETVDWRPIETKRTRRCRYIELAFAPEPIVGSSFTTCRGTWGLRWIGVHSLRFGWTGRRRADAWIGTGGGAMFAYPEGGAVEVRLRFRLLYCLSGETSCEANRPRKGPAKGA
jgi:hypothetical protein